MSCAGHAIFSPSSASRWLRCPGSAILAAQAPVRPSGTAALLGTRAHLLAERTLKRQPLPEFVGPKEAKLALPYVQHVEKLVKARKGRVHVWIEEQLTIAPDCWGTADTMIWAPEERRLDIVDFKSGRWPVAADGPQNILYSTGGYLILPAAETITAWIVQPLVNEEPKFAIFEPWELLGMLELIKRRIAFAKSRDARALVPGAWCAFCPARPTCPAITAELLAKMPPIDEEDGHDELDFPG